ncbi:MAG: hypothetical protein LQ340_007428 [Diploschistes diacapsis]|nr:MAG: hypothetical protein LQ340_007428 [Diploschistes diacapsis]
MIIPVTFLGTISALSGQFSPRVQTVDTLLRLPQTFGWVWINVLLFSISNQRSEEAVLEDLINKPWRPLPSGRITPPQARRLLLFCIPLIFMVCSLWLGAAEESAYCTILTWMYNDLGGADEHFLIRNGINSLAYFLYGSGALRVAVGPSMQAFGPETCEWLGIISGIIFTTMQVQDLKDQDGDRARKRSTVPLDLGDGPTRWTILAGVACWSIFCPYYWSLGLTGFAVLPICLGAMVGYRVITHRDPAGDTRTYKWWSLWLMAICALPAAVQL